MNSFAASYIKKNVVYPPFICDGPSDSIGMVVMIPCLNEPEIIRTLGSLWACTPIVSDMEVIVIVNNSEASAPEVKAFNRKTYHELIAWKIQNDRPGMILHPIFVDSVSAKHAGAGMARKIGMDEAIRRFDMVNKANGIIVSTDADCLFSSNYLTSIESAFRNKDCFAVTLNFKHRISEIEDEKQRLGIQLYEDYLHYYKKSHDFIGYPDSIYTIGSAFAVRADAYIKQGGMNRRQAGEDFYFLYKLTKLGSISFINEAYVYPSGRISDRVPFGTGASMTKWMNDSEDLHKTYNFAAFSDLKQLFDEVDKLYRANKENLQVLINTLPVSVQDYLFSISFVSKVEEVNRNSSSPESFRKRFFQFFDAFLILRFLNLANENYYTRQDLQEAIKSLQQACSQTK
jgi:hypothetical protein